MDTICPAEMFIVSMPKPVMLSCVGKNCHGKDPPRHLLYMYTRGGGCTDPPDTFRIEYPVG